MSGIDATAWGASEPREGAGPPGGAGFVGQIPSSGDHGIAGFGGPVYGSPAPADLGAPPKLAEQLAYERGQRDMLRRVTTPRMTGWRIICGICWALWTLLFGISALVSVFHASFGPFLIGGILAGLAGWYDYRIWTLKARRLTLFVIF